MGKRIVNRNMKHSIFLLLVIGLILLLILPLTYALDKSRYEIGAKTINDLGITGKGNTICLIDDGVDYTHPNLGNCSLNQILSGSCQTFIAVTDLAENDNDPFPEGTQEHGTKVAGIILSNHSKYRGIAVDSKIAFVRIWDYDFANEESKTNNSLVLDAIQWCIDNKELYNISAISLSMGLGFNQPANVVTEFQNKINDAIKKGIVFVKSSGNRENGDSYDMTFPAELGNVTAVGSTTGNEVSYFTRRTSNTDLLAPGDKIITTMVGGTFISFFGDIICWHNSDFIAGSNIIRRWLPFCNYGTSFSAPHVAASVALLKEYDPALTPFAIESLLKDTGNPIRDSITGLTFKKLNLVNALGVLDWPFYHHDIRRTGFTLLKGDLNTDQVVNASFILDKSVNASYVDLPSISDIDKDGRMELVTVSQLGLNPNEAKIYVMEYDSKKRIWKQELKIMAPSSQIGRPPSIADIDDDETKEIIFIRKQGNDAKVYAADKIQINEDVKMMVMVSNFVVYGEEYIIVESFEVVEREEEE